MFMPFSPVIALQATGRARIVKGITFHKTGVMIVQFFIAISFPDFIYALRVYPKPPVNAFNKWSFLCEDMWMVSPFVIIILPPLPFWYFFTLSRFMMCDW